MRFAAFGRTSMCFNTIEALVRAGHTPTIIGTCRAAPEAAVREADFERLAERLGIPFFNNIRINSDEIVDQLASTNSEIAVSVNWLNILRQKVCDLFPHGVINGHAGDLPRYRGSAPWAYAILNGESRMGICIHKMDPGELDSGAILLREFVPIGRDTKVGDLIDACERLIPKMFVDVLTGLEKRRIRSEPQSDEPSLVLRGFPREPVDGLIRWEQSAEQIARVVRASSKPYAGAYTFFEGEELHVWDAQPHDIQDPHLGVPGQLIQRNSDTGSVWVLTGNGSVELKQISYRGETQQAPADLLRSLRIRLGMRIEDEILTLRQRVNALTERLVRIEGERGE